MCAVSRTVYVFISSRFYFQSETDSQCAYVLLLLYTSSPYTHT